MKKILTNLNDHYPEIFRELKNNLYIEAVNDVNHRLCTYQGNLNTLYELNIVKNKNIPIETIITRFIGNVPNHTDDIFEYKKYVYLLVLDVSAPATHYDSQKFPLLYQNKQFLELKKGDLVQFDQTKEHALFWDKRIDIAAFWLRKEYI